MSAIRRFLLVFLAASVLTSGCSNKFTADKAHFSRAINAYYADKLACITKLRFPFRIEEETINYAKYKPLMDALVIEKLRSEKVDIRVIDRIARVKYKVKVHSYRLTRRGSKSYHDGRLCFGQYRVDDITEIDKREKIAWVKYNYTLTHLAPWADNPYIQSHHVPKLHKQGKAKLLLTDQGWVHEKMRSNLVKR